MAGYEEMQGKPLDVKDHPVRDMPAEEYNGHINNSEQLRRFYRDAPGIPEGSINPKGREDLMSVSKNRLS